LVGFCRGRESAKSNVKDRSALPAKGAPDGQRLPLFVGGRQKAALLEALVQHGGGDRKRLSGGFAESLGCRHSSGGIEVNAGVINPTDQLP
jgi:hypothetical protein